MLYREFGTGLCLGQRGLIIARERGGRNSSCTTERWELVCEFVFRSAWHNYCRR